LRTSTRGKVTPFPVFVSLILSSWFSSIGKPTFELQLPRLFSSGRQADLPFPASRLLPLPRQAG
jgi:hypothetical protein